MRILARGIVALLTLPALVAVATPSGAAADPEPVADAADWLAAHLPDDDLGVSVEIALALEEVEAHPETVAGIRDDAEAQAGPYAGQSAEAAEAAARIVELAVATGGDPADFGGVDLVERLESLVDGSGAASADTAVQARVVGALDAVGSDRLDGATADLLARQCADGSFAPGIECEEFPLDIDVVATANAVLALAGREGTSDAVAEALRDARNALLARQSFSTGALGGTTPINARAARAFAALGEADAAARAASWVRAQQLTSVGRCDSVTPDEEGAVSLDGASWIDETNLEEFVRATAGAVPALRWTEARVGQPVVLDPSGYVRADTGFTIRVDNLAPGESVCMVVPGFGYGIFAADADGRKLMFTPGLSDGESSRLSLATIDGTFADLEYTGLGATKPPVKLKKKVAQGARQTVRVTGLAPAESVTLRVDGGRVARGRATPAGDFTTSFRATGRPRTATVVVRGEFANRTNSKTYRIVR